MSTAPLYLICAEAHQGQAYARSCPRNTEVVTRPEQLSNAPEGFAFHLVTPPSVELWLYVAEHGGKDWAPHTWERLPA